MSVHLCYPTPIGSIDVRRTENGLSVFYLYRDQEFELAFIEHKEAGICLGVYDPTCPRTAPFCAVTYTEQELLEFMSSFNSHQNQ